MALKLGTENKKKVILAAVLALAVVALIFWDVDRVFLGSSTPASASQSDASSGSAAGPSNAGQNAQQVAVTLSQLDPTLHPEVMAAAESLPYVGTGRNIFSMNSTPTVPIERVQGPVRPSQTIAQQVPTGPPPPPNIDIQFFGYSLQNGERKAFLLHGNNIFIASAGQVVDHHYRVLAILPFSIEIRDLLTNNTQEIPLIRH